MSLGSSTYGSSVLGGSANANNEQVFFAHHQWPKDTLLVARAEFAGPEEWYEILTFLYSEPEGVEFKVYSSHGEGETPQLQVTYGGNSQIIIGAAPIIVVTVMIDGALWSGGYDFRVVGRPYVQ